jgi:hypothetical protein
MRDTIVNEDTEFSLHNYCRIPTFERMPTYSDFNDFLYKLGCSN